MNEPESKEPESKEKIRPRWGRIAVWVGLLLLLGAIALSLNRSQEGPVAIGQQVPDFTLTTFDGQSIHLKDLRGKIVLVNFWASWCKPCEQEAAALQEAWVGYEEGQKVAFLGVDYVDTEPEAKAYLKRFAITYPNGPDLGTKISQAFRIRGVPETYIIDREGVLQFVQIGPFQSVAHIQSVIDPMLGQ